jgi:hypothetical protein
MKNLLKLKKLANDFGLKFNVKKFNVVFIPKEDIILYLYLIGCPDKEYSKYGKTHIQRIKNIDRFLQSNEFHILKRKYAGTIIEKKPLEKIKLAKIKNPKIQNTATKLVKELKRKEFLAALLPIIKNQKERKFLLNVVLFHEWIHTLLLENGINFQRKTIAKWYLDEGLASYMQLFSEKGKSDLSNKANNYKNSNVRKGFLIWNKLLKDKLTPKERLNAILSRKAT